MRSCNGAGAFVSFLGEDRGMRWDRRRAPNHPGRLRADWALAEQGDCDVGGLQRASPWDRLRRMSVCDASCGWLIKKDFGIESA